MFIICTLSVTLYCGIDAAWRGMERNLDSQFDACNLADIWVQGEVSDRQAQAIADLPGVADAQRRVSLRATVKSLPAEPKLDISMTDGLPRINRALLLSGEELSELSKNVCILNEAFAEANGLGIGDTLSIDAEGQRLDLTIGGIGYQSEYVVYSNGQTFKADPTTFGYALLSPGTLSMLPYGEISVTLEAGASEMEVKQAVEDLLDDPQMMVLVRGDKMGLKMAIEEVEQIRAIGQIFPVIFFLVAALITWSTMKRLVDNQRQQIGTLCSLGYKRSQLKLHYTSFGFLVALPGAILGLLLARFFLGSVIVSLLESIYILPGGAAYLDPLTAVVICLVTVLIASGASYLSCRQSLKEVPAALLRPKPPSKGRRVFLERIPFLWRHFSFSNKMIVRNMARNLSRLLIGLLGVVGCTALLLTGFGMRDSISYVMEHHYGYTMRYDVRATLDESMLSDEYLDALRARSGAETMESMMETSAEVFLDGTWQAKLLYVVEDESDMLYLEDAEGGRVRLPDSGVALTEKFCEDTGLGLGDTIEIRALNGHTTFVEVTEIISVQLGQGIYVNRSEWRRMDLMPYSPNVLMLTGGTIDTAALEDLSGVDTVHTLEQERSDNGMVVQVLDVVVLLLVLFAGALALVVLYTLGQLNFFERQRELATLMVLGFFPRETKRIILRENIIIAVLGIPIGLLLGPYLLRWILTTGLPNTLEFIPHVAPLSWVYTPLLALAFAQIVNWMVGAKFKHVDMVEALKSVE